MPMVFFQPVNFGNPVSWKNCVQMVFQMFESCWTEVKKMVFWKRIHASMFVIPAVACYPPPCQHQLSLALDLAWDTQVTKVGCHFAPEKKLETSYQKKKLPSAALFHHRESRPEIFLPKKSLWKRLESLSCLAIPMTSGMDDIISTSTDWRRTLVCQNWWFCWKIYKFP